MSVFPARGIRLRSCSERRTLLVAAAAALSLPRGAWATDADPDAAPALAAFSGGQPSAGMPAGWIEQRLRGVPPNRFQLVQDPAVRQVVLQIDAQSSASTLVHAVERWTPADRLEVRWSVERFPEGGRLGVRAADDFGARVYVNFDYPLARVPFGQRTMIRAARMMYGEGVPAAALCYVWSPGATPGTMVPSPYTERVRMVVARGDEQAGRWAVDRLDIAADFVRAFGAEYGTGWPPLLSIGLACDADQTGTVSGCRFADPRFVR